MVKHELASLIDDNGLELSLSDFCKVCCINADDVLRYIDHSVIEPPVKEGEWLFVFSEFNEPDECKEIWESIQRGSH
ncbi:MAG: hypothetical protein ACI9FR_001283 [Cryomorphaceae bacterium]|jgi:hypothetical protein